MGEVSHARLKTNPYRPALPTLFLTNSRSLTNKMDEIKMRTTPHYVTIITETWLNHNIPDAAIKVAGCSVQSRLNEGLWEEQRGLVCLREQQLVHGQHCYRETLLLGLIVFNDQIQTLLPAERDPSSFHCSRLRPSHANAKQAMGSLYDAISKQLNKHPE